MRFCLPSTGRWLASAGKDHTVRVWDLQRYKDPLWPKLPWCTPRIPITFTTWPGRHWAIGWHQRRTMARSARGTEALAQGTLTLMATWQGHDDQVSTGGLIHTIRSWHRQRKIAPFAPGGLLTGNLSECSSKPGQSRCPGLLPDGGLLLAGNFSPPKPDRLTLFAYPTGKEHRVLPAMITRSWPRPLSERPVGSQWRGEQKEFLLWHAHTGETLSHSQAGAACLCRKLFPGWPLCQLGAHCWLRCVSYTGTSRLKLISPNSSFCLVPARGRCSASPGG